MNEIRRQRLQIQLTRGRRSHWLLMTLTLCEPLAESWGMEAYEGRSRGGDTSNSLICNTATIFKRNKGDKGDGDVSARTTDYNDRAIPVALRNGRGRKQGEKEGGEEKQRRGKKSRPWCKVHHHSCTDWTVECSIKGLLSVHPGVMKPWGTDAKQPNSQGAA